MSESHVHNEQCKALRAALDAAKARLHAAPVRPTLTDDAGVVAVRMHLDQRDAINAEIDELERALHESGCIARHDPSERVPAAATHLHDERCKSLRAALSAAKARLHAAPVRSTVSDDAGGVALAMHMEDRDALNAEVDRIERALHEMGCR